MVLGGNGWQFNRLGPFFGPLFWPVFGPIFWNCFMKFLLLKQVDTYTFSKCDFRAVFWATFRAEKKSIKLPPWWRWGKGSGEAVCVRVIKRICWIYIVYYISSKWYTASGYTYQPVCRKPLPWWCQYGAPSLPSGGQCQICLRLNTWMFPGLEKCLANKSLIQDWTSVLNLLDYQVSMNVDCYHRYTISVPDGVIRD